MSSEELIFTSSRVLSSPEQEKDTLSIKLPFGSPIHEEEHMTSGEISLEHGGKDLPPAEQVSIFLTPPEPEPTEPGDDEEFMDAWFHFLEFERTHGDYFPPKFRKCMVDELKWYRVDISGEPRDFYDCPFWRNSESKGSSWVFWRRKDVDGPPSDDTFKDLIPDVYASPKVRDNIRHALKKLISCREFSGCLVQFWAATKTLEGRTFLTAQYQPFALGPTCSASDRQLLCEYRMMMMRGEYKFYADAEGGEQQLGLPGRVFLHKFPESTPDVRNYSLREYPQLLDALECLIKGSWALPVFDRSSQTCVGVLEIVSLLNMPSVWHEKSFLGHMCGIFKEFGLQILDGYEHRELQNGKGTMQIDSSDQQSMDPYVGTMEQNIIVDSSPEEGARKTQEKEHKKAGVRIEASFEDVLKCSKMSFNNAARKLKVSRSRLKRICRGYGIYRWPPRKINMVLKICRGYGIYRWLPRKINMVRKINRVCYSRLLPDEDHEQIPKLPSEQASSSVGNIKPVLQDANMVTIKAKYENYTLKFKLPLLSRLEDLRQEVAKRLKNLGTGTYYVKYKDEDDELILIACDEDLQDCIHTCRSMDKSTIVLLLEPEQPITNLNPTD